LCGDNVWRYCPTKDNPADLLTRGITSEELQQNEIWFSGPKWLNSKEDWPTWNGNNVTSSVCTTMSENDDKIETMENNQNVCIGIGEIIDIERYNSYRKLTRITAYVMRFATNCRATETERKKDLLRIDEIENAKFLWIRYKQDNIRSPTVTTRKYYRDRFSRISTSTDAYKYSFTPRTIVDWNKLPECAIQAPTTVAFQKTKRGAEKLWSRIKGSDGKCKDDKESILEEQVSFYKILFTSKGWDREAAENLLQNIDHKLTEENKKNVGN
ncbi:Hypothetical predicted protein, partial [Mytilus galloprovincialis]